MDLLSRLVNSSIRGLTRVICHVHDAELARVPAKGPLILVLNHVNFLDVPLLGTHLLPRPVTGFAKIETWDNPIMAWLFDLWGAIPIRRGEVDTEALRRALAALEAGKILGMAPEGTRSGHGCLQRGRSGVVLLALRSGAPLLPVVFYGGEKLRWNLSHLRRTEFHIVVGQLFHLEAGGARVSREVRQSMTDQIMYQMAALLPPAYRGSYADLEHATESFLRFPAGSASNLGRATAARQTLEL